MDIVYYILITLIILLLIYLVYSLFMKDHVDVREIPVVRSAHHSKNQVKTDEDRLVLSRLYSIEDQITDIKKILQNINQMISILEKQSGGIENKTNEKKDLNQQNKILINNYHRKNLEEQLQDICALYNAGLSDRDASSKFTQNYKITRIEMSNSMEWMKDNNITPEFRNSNSGVYYAVDIGKVDDYAVVLHYGLTFQEIMTKVFECPAINPQRIYSIGSIIRPAIFERNGNDTWKLKQKGKLNFGSIS